jgi:plasmid stabilization system protein ParE
MAKKIIGWTTRSIIDRTNIYRYWLERNQSDIYPEKLEQLFEKSAELISNFQNIGTQTNHRNVYSKVIRDYKIFYRIETDEIQILRVWDTRQHPDSAGK